MRALATIVLALLAPAPFPKPIDSREWQALYRTAEACRAEVERLNARACVIDDRSLEQRAEEQKEITRLNRRAAEQYERLAGLLETAPGKAARWRADESGLKAGKAWFRASEYARALATYDSVVRLSANPETRVDALGGTVRCHAELGQTAQVRERLKSIRKELPALPERIRGEWERWVAAAEKEIR